MKNKYYNTDLDISTKYYSIININKHDKSLIVSGYTNDVVISIKSFFYNYNLQVILILECNNSNDLNNVLNDLGYEDELIYVNKELI